MNQLENIDWKAAVREASEILSAYIKINTCNPPGNETEGALFLNEILEKEGLKTNLVGPEPNRKSIWADWEGSSQEKPLMLLHHIDTVPFNADDWERDPLGGEIIDGKIWGRGALDCKSIGVAHLMGLLILKRLGIELIRGVRFAGTADEEAGGKSGVDWLLQNEAEFGDVSGVLNEGGGYRALTHQGSNLYLCQIGERGVLWLKLIFSGPSGHASIPRKDNCLVAMSKFIAALDDSPPRQLLHEAIYNFIGNLEDMGLPNPKLLLYEKRDLADKQLYNLRRILLPSCRTTFSPTIAKSGYKTNVIPAEAEVHLDCRYVPGDNPEMIVKYLRSKIESEGEVKLEVMGHHHPTINNSGGDILSSLKAAMKDIDSGSWVAPYFFYAATDSRFFIQRGIPAYGFIPMHNEGDVDTYQKMVHGVNEKISMEDMLIGIKFVVRMLYYYCCLPIENRPIPEVVNPMANISCD